MKIDIYSDIACPWCYIGERRLAQALETFPHGASVEVRFRPFQLDPAAPPGARPLLGVLEQKFGRQVAQKMGQVEAAARSEGIEMRFDGAWAVNTLPAHRLIWLASKTSGEPAGRTMAERLFAAYFTDGADLSDPDTLIGLAVAAGLDRERVAAFLDSDEGVADVTAEIEQAQQMGITAVPTFVFEDRYALQGAQPASVFRDALAEIHRRTQPVTAADAESCDDGSCAA